MTRLTGAVVAVLLGAATTPLSAQRTLEPLLEIGLARSTAATLADRSATGTSGASPYRESTFLRLAGQWGVIAEARVPVGRAKVWGIEVYGARFSGDAHAAAGRAVQNATVPSLIALDSVDYRLKRVVSLRGTLGVVRAVPLPAGLEGALLLGGTVGKITSPDAACSTASCPPVLSLSTPGVTGGADVMTREWHRFRVRLALKTAALRVDEAEVRRQFRWTAFSGAPAGEGEPRWHLFPSGALGIEYRFLF